MHPSLRPRFGSASCSGSHDKKMMQRGSPTPVLIALQMRAPVGLLGAMQYAAMLQNAFAKGEGVPFQCD